MLGEILKSIVGLACVFPITQIENGICESTLVPRAETPMDRMPRNLIERKLKQSGTEIKSPRLQTAHDGGVLCRSGGETAGDHCICADGILMDAASDSTASSSSGCGIAR